MIGRTEGADIRIPHPTMSRRHARITVEGSRVTIEDVASTSGIYIDEQLVASAELAIGTRIRIGGLIFELCVVEDSFRTSSDP